MGIYRRFRLRADGETMTATLILLILAPCGVLDGRTGAEPPIYRVSAYCPCERCCGVWADGITASGHVIKPGDRFVAADKRFEFGQMFVIPGYGRVPVLDRGGAIKGFRLDLYFDTHQEALRWGVKYYTE